MFLAPSTAHRLGPHVASQGAALRPATPTGYEALQAHPEYAPYFNTTHIRESDEAALRAFFFNYPNVDQDSCLCVTVKRGEPLTFALTTDGVGPCLAICARGRNPAGETVLYLAHESSDIGRIAIERALKVLCLQHGCHPADVGIYILGGQAPEVDAQGRAIVEASGSDEGDEGDEGDDPLHYRETLEALADYPQVKAVRLPIMPFSKDSTELATAVVLTETEVLYCRSNSMPQHGYENCKGGDLVPVNDADLSAIAEFNRDAVEQARMVKFYQTYHPGAALPQPTALGGALSKDIDAKGT